MPIRCYPYSTIWFSPPSHLIISRCNVWNVSLTLSALKSGSRGVSTILSVLREQANKRINSTYALLGMIISPFMMGQLGMQSLGNAYGVTAPKGRGEI